MITSISKVLEDVIPQFDETELIYTEHSVRGEYDKTNHLLLIRHAMTCHYGCELEYYLDPEEVKNELEKELPVEVTFDRIVTIEGGKTYRFYITIKDEEIE